MNAPSQTDLCEAPCAPVFLLADVEKKAAVARNDETGSKGAPISRLVGEKILPSSVAGFKSELMRGVVPTDRNEAWLMDYSSTKQK
jgi:hypothetical protein